MASRCPDRRIDCKSILLARQSARFARVTLRWRRPINVSRRLAIPYPVRSMTSRWRGMVGMIAGVGLALGIGMTLLGVSQGSTDLSRLTTRISGVDLYVITNGGKLVSFLPGDSPGTIKQARARLAEIRGCQGWIRPQGTPGHWSETCPDAHQRDAPTELFTVVGVDGDPSAISNSTVLSSGRWVRRGDEIVLGKKLSL